MVALHPIVSDFIHTKVPGCEGPRHLRRPFHPRGPVAKTRVCLDRVFQCVPSRVLGFADDCWATEWWRRGNRRDMNRWRRGERRESGEPKTRQERSRDERRLA